MGKALYERSRLARTYFKKANDLLGFAITDIMFEGSAGDLKQTQYAQPAIFLHSFIRTKIMGKAFKPDMVAGHSLGEISALAAVGSLTFEAALKLISRRAAAMQKVCEVENTGMAVVVGLYDVIVKDICEQIEGIVVPANYNTLNQVVISGEKKALKKASKKLSPAAKAVVPLPVSGAFHSPFMEPAREELRLAIADTEFKVPICPIYQNLGGWPTMDTGIIRENLLGQLTNPVMWRHTILHMIGDGATEFTEIGPGSLLSKFVHQIDARVKTAEIA